VKFSSHFWISIQLFISECCLLVCLILHMTSLRFVFLDVPTRHFYYNSTSLPIIIETSDRPSHQLVSRLLKILLTEVLGYSQVQLKHGYNSMNVTHILKRISGLDHRWRKLFIYVIVYILIIRIITQLIIMQQIIFMKSKNRQLVFIMIFRELPYCNSSQYIFLGICHQ